MQQLSDLLERIQLELAAGSVWIRSGRRVFWQGLGQGVDGAFEFGQVVVDGRLQDCVGGVEVAVGRWSRMAAICRQGMDG